MVPSRYSDAAHWLHCAGPGPKQATHGAAHGAHVLDPTSAYMPAGHDVSHVLVPAKYKYGLAQEVHPELLPDVQVRHVVSQGWQVPVPSS